MKKLFRSAKFLSIIFVFLLSATTIIYKHELSHAISVFANNFSVAGTPTVTSVTPTQHATGVSANANITVDFSEAIDTGTVDGTSFIVIGSQSGIHTGSYTFPGGGTSAEINPTNDFFAGEKVQVILTTDVLSSSTSSPLDRTYIFEYWIDAPVGYINFSENSTTAFNNSPINTDPGDVQLVDLNADRDLDIILSSAQRGVEFWFGDGAGGFATPTNLVTPTNGLSEAQIVVAPMDDNTSPDIVLKLALNVRVFLNNGSGGFPSEMTIDLGVGDIGSGTLLVEDFNGDGDFDLAISDTQNDQLDVFFSNGTDTITYSATYALGDNYFYISAGDLDNDFDVDIFAMTNNGFVNKARILTNGGTGVFSVGSVFDPDGSFGEVSLAPFLPGNNNLHGILTDSDGTADHLSFLENNGAAVFSDTSIATSLHNLRLASNVGDFNADDKLDVIIVNDTVDYYNIFINNSVGSQSFSGNGQIPISDIGDITTGDIDGDGDLDLITLTDPGATASFKVHLAGQSVPLEVTDLGAAGASGQVVLSWTAPGDGGASITDYIVEYGLTAGFPGNATIFNDGVSATPGATVTGLTNGSSYSFQVSAVNSIGTGSSSNIASAIASVSWALNTTDSLLDGVNGSSAISHDGKVYHLGGNNGGSAAAHKDTVQIYDPNAIAGSRWSIDSTDPMPTGMSNGAAALVGGKIYYLMGRSQGSSAADTVFIYDPSAPDTTRWTTGTSAGASFARQSMAFGVEGDIIYLLGGFDDSGTELDTVIAYNTALDSWTTAGFSSMPSAKGWLTGQYIGGSIFVAGGASSTVYEYDISGDTWSTKTAHPLSDLQSPCSTIHNGEFYVISGLNGDTFDEYLEVYKYNPGGDSWTQVSTLNEHRKRCAAVTLGDVLYTLAGEDFDTSYRDDFETLDLTIPNTAPSVPSIVSPLNGGVVISQTPELYALYSDPDSNDTGFIDFRISDSAVNCLNNGNIAFSGTSAETSTNLEPAKLKVISPLTNNFTYYWCTRADDGTDTTAWTSMGSFTVDTTIIPLGYGYATVLGGSLSGDSFANSVLVDDQGNAYVFSNTDETDFPVTPGAFQSTFAGGTNDCTLTKVNPTGDAIIFSTYLGGSSHIGAGCEGRTMDIDSDYQIVVSGATNAADFPTTTGAYDESYNGGASGSDCFVTKFNAAGSDLIFSTFVGGGTASAYERCSNVQLDASDNVYVHGVTFDSAFPTTGGAYQTVYGGNGDNMAFKLDPTGSTLLFSTFIGGSGEDGDPYGMDLSASGEMLMLTSTNSADYPTTGGAYDVSQNGSHDYGITKLNATGTALVFSTFLGGTDYESGWGGDIRYGTGNNVYIAGTTWSNDFPTTPGAYQTVFGGTADAFAAVISADGSSLLASTYYGGSGEESAGNGLGLDSSNNFIFGGWTESANLPVTSFAEDTTVDTVNWDAYIAKISADATSLVYATVVGGDADWEGFYSATIDNQNNGYFAGDTYSSDYPLTSGAFDTTVDSGDATVVKFSFTGPASPVLISPTNASNLTETNPTLSAQYLEPDAGDTGFVNYRVSSTSAADCLNNVNIDFSGTSLETASTNEATSIIVNPGLTAGATYYWCAQADDGVVQSYWTTMGTFSIESGSSLSKKLQLQVPPQETQDPDQSTEEPETDDSESESPVEETEEEIPENEQEDVVEEPTIEEPEEDTSDEAPVIPQQEQEEAPGDQLPPPPQPEPTLEETQQIDRVIDELTSESEEPTESVTRSQSDGRSFSIDVEEGEDQLQVNGLAMTDQDRIEFTGTTSEPNSTITLIFNGSITVVVTSGAEGFWQTFVSADQLGLTEGQSADVRIQAIAVKDDLESDLVDLGTISLELSQQEEVVADFESVVEEGVVTTNINALIAQIDQLIEEQENIIQTTLTIAAPVVVISSAPLWGYLPYFPALIYHLITYIIGLLGRRKQDDTTVFGQVYDAITKKPLGLAVLRIYTKETNKLVTTKVTDKLGRYDLLLEPGEYRIEVKKPEYTFPSKIVTSGPDGDHSVVYNVQKGYLSQEGAIQVPDIPVDPINAKKQWAIASLFKKLWLALQKAGHFLVVPTLFIGALAALAAVMAVPESTENWIIAGVYILLLILQLQLRTKLERAWGVVYDLATSAVLPLTTIQLVDPQYGKVVTSRLTDYEGRFAFLPSPGSYILKANKPGYEQAEVVESGDTKHQPITGKVSVEKQGQRIDGDIPMRQL